MDKVQWLTFLAHPVDVKFTRAHEPSYCVL